MPLVWVILFPHLDDIASAACNKRHLCCMRSRATDENDELWVNELYDTLNPTRSLNSFQSFLAIENG